ncbi:DUF899 family protein [Devosia sp.]|uniref:DUF899 family protein n=1 Tax=Devosia sp. TaxID=1871048 RepID=UPI003A8F00CD
MDRPMLTPAAELAASNPTRHPGESAAYRAARQDLLTAEIELRRQIEHVAEMRRALPPGAILEKDYRFVGEHGEVSLGELFGAHPSLVIYSYMFGPQRQRPCPMCTAMMASLEGSIPDILQRTGIALVARSPIERLREWKAARGWSHMPIYSDPSGDYTRDWVSQDDADRPAYNVFRRDGDAIRHFWSEEISEADPGQDPRSAIEMSTLWLVQDSLPQGRDPDWRPRLSY